MATRVDYEARFYETLKRIAAYMQPATLRRRCEREYGLEYGEALEGAYENVIWEAQAALKGYRKPRAGAKAGTKQETATPSVAHSAPK